MKSAHTDPDQRRLTAALYDQLTTSERVDGDAEQRHELAATLANTARNLGWRPPSPSRTTDQAKETK